MRCLEEPPIPKALVLSPFPPIASAPAQALQCFFSMLSSPFCLLRLNFSLLQSGFWHPAPIYPRFSPSLLAMLFPNISPVCSQPYFPAAALNSEQFFVFPWVWRWARHYTQQPQGVASAVGSTHYGMFWGCGWYLFAGCNTLQRARNGKLPRV